MASQDSIPPFIAPGRVYNVKFGKSLVDKQRRKHDHSYQSISFDFKPISLSDTKAAKLSVNHEENSLAIKVSREPAGVKHEATADAVESTLFRGPKRPCQKDFVLIWNHTSGEITLERLECTPTLKQKRTGNWPPPASTYALAPESTPEPAKPKGKAKTKRSSGASKPAGPLQADSNSQGLATASTSGFKHAMSGFVAGPNLESVPNSSTDLLPGPGTERDKQEASDSDSDSSSSSYTSSSDGSDSSEDTPKHKPDLPPLHDPPQLHLKNNVDLSESGSDSN